MNRVAWSLPARLPVSVELHVTSSNVLLNKAKQKKIVSEVNPSTRRQQEAASGPASSPLVHLRQKSP